MSSEDQKTRELAAANAREILLDPKHLVGPREPSRPLDSSKMAAGGNFKEWDARHDARMRIADVLQHADLPAHVRAVLQKAFDDTTIATLRRVQNAMRKVADGKSTPDVTSTAAIVLAEDLEYNLAALGSAKANAAVCANALYRAQAAVRSGSPAKFWLYLRQALRTSSEAQEDLSEAGYVKEPNDPILSGYDEMAHLFAGSLGIVSDALKMIADEEVILRGGAGAWAEVSDELAGIIWPDGQSRPAPSAAPTLVVLAKGSLDHLPGSETSGSSRTSRSSTPRGEYGPLAGVALPLIHGVDVVAVGRRLDARFPWFSDLTGLLLRDLAVGRFARLRATLVVSPPGSGKTSYLRAFCEACGIPVVLYSAAGVADAAFGGTSRQWSTGRGCLPLQTIQRFKVANPAILLDEIEKAGTRAENGRLVDSLVALLEPAGSRAYLDPYLETECDLSAVQYLATANSTDGIPGPLLDRLRVVHVGLPRAQDLAVAAANILADLRAERGLDEAWVPALDADETQLLGRVWRGGSLRPLRRAVTALIDSREHLAPRH